MRSFKRPQALAWFTSLALLWALLASAWGPAMAGARTSPGAGGWASVCTSTGLMDLRGAPAGPDAPADAPLMAGMHCAWCCAHASLAAPPAPPDFDTSLRKDLSTPWPALYFQAPHRLHAWATAQPRGPPAA